MVNHVIQPSGPNYTNIHASKTICFSASHYNHNVREQTEYRPTISDWSRKDAFVSSRLNYLIRCCLACLTAFFEDFRLYKTLQHALLLLDCVNSAGVRVFAARGICMCCRPRLSDQFCYQGIFQDFRHGGVNQPLWVPAFSLPSPSLSHCHFPTPSPPIP